MFEREYRREMDQVKLSQVELDRLVNAMAEEKRRHRRGGGQGEGERGSGCS